MGKKKSYCLYQKRGVYYVQWRYRGKQTAKSTKTKNRREAERIAKKLFNANVIDSSIDNILKAWKTDKEYEGRSDRTIEDGEIHCMKFSDWLFKTIIAIRNLAH